MEAESASTLLLSTLSLVVTVPITSPSADKGEPMSILNDVVIGNDGVGWPVLVHSARTAVAAVASLLAAQLFGLSEAYWAPITTLVVTQSSLGAAFAVSWQRFV